MPPKKKPPPQQTKQSALRKEFVPKRKAPRVRSGAEVHVAPALSEAELEAKATAAISSLREKQRVLMEQHGLGKFSRWDADLEACRLIFHDGDETALVAQVVPIGSVADGMSWLWAWANESLPIEVRVLAEPLQDLAEVLGAEMFRQSSFVAPPETLNFMLAMSCERLAAVGFYSLPGKTNRLYLALTSVAKPD